MADLLTKLHSLLSQAQAAELSLVDRLRALGKLTQTLDQIFVLHALDHRTLRAEVDPDQSDQVKQVIASASRLFNEAAQIARQQLLPTLILYQVQLAPVEQLGEQQQEWLFDYFRQRIYPLLTPLAVDSGRPFPYISSDSLNLLILLQRPGSYSGKLYARVKVPRKLVPCLITVPPLAKVDSPVLYNDSKRTYWVWSEDVVRFFVHDLFAGMSVTGIYQFRVLRAGVNHDDEQTGLAERSTRQKVALVARLDVQNTMPEPVLQWLTLRLGVPPQAVFSCTTPLRMTNLLELADRLDALHTRSVLEQGMAFVHTGEKS